MQFTKLEIKGFKSFADKVVINFDEGITGIVGPNGCGKSNVVDAIRWVLGEQKSRILRSDKMENVVFNGTKQRTATQLAEVSLTFDNTKNLIPTEYNQVTVTRRYFRSGESEYLLNGVACRLKDITNLFLDTGIASNSYAIIELKMVDDLLNDKENSRRSLFEEAAGISKFKIRKKETLRKLEGTDADLDRVEDLLFEIEKNLKSLEKQANQAKKYYEIKEEYKLSSVALAKSATDSRQTNFDQIQKSIDEENDKKIAINSLINEKETAILKAQNELILKEQTLSSRQKNLNNHVDKIRKYESEKEIKTERQKFLQDKINNLNDTIKIDQESLERSKNAIKGLVEEAEKESRAFEEFELQLNKQKQALDAQKEKTYLANSTFRSSNEKFSTAKDNFFQASKEIEIKEIQIKSLENELSKTKDDSSTHTDNIKGFEEKIIELNLSIKQKEKELSDLTHVQIQLEESIASRNKEKESTMEELANVNRFLDAKQNEYNLTKSLVDNLEGFPETIKFLKKTKDWIEAPLLSEIIFCREEYRIAIENYLEPFMNFYVVDTAQHAIDAIQLLSGTAKGKANFFILDRLEPVSPIAVSNAGLVAVLEISEYDKKYNSLMQTLLGNVYLSESAEIPQDKSIILLEQSGKIGFNKEHIFGGSIGLFEGKKIGRSKNLEKLQTTIEQTEKQKVLLLNKLDVIAEDTQVLNDKDRKGNIKTKESELNTLNQTLISLESKKEQFQDLINTSQVRKDDILKQIQSLQAALSELKPKVADGENGIVILKKDLDQRRADLEREQQTQEKLAADYNEKNVNYHQRKNRMEAVYREISFKQETHTNTEERIQRSKAELVTVNHSLEELIKTASAGDDELQEMYEEKESLEQGVSEAEKEYYKARDLISIEDKNLRETQRSREEIDQSLMNRQNELNEVKLGLNSIKDRLAVEFNIELEKVTDEEIADFVTFSQNELQEKVEKLRTRIERMGSINPMAMDAFEEIKERHKFISNQKRDLTDAKESLLTTITEIDKVAKETFLEAFDKIKDNFIRVFRNLFSEEDDCDLILTEPDNPLESPVDIIAKPKGKRPLTINQLSGGEKTLTATSLLFSIYLLKPAPFCIFDEVDAPLDDANIDKFNEIIRKFAKESQFIIVTHNKRTMASTDVMYGITMQEQGVSKIVPVDLREFWLNQSTLKKV